jgi:putative SOS response-associated peptidase YedK
VPADGFYEWGGEGGDRHPFWFHARRGDPLLFAGLYRSDDEGACGFAILTTAANQTVATVHHRMPVIVPREQIDEWLRGQHAERLLHPAPEDLLEAREVGRRVNSTKNDDEACLEPASSPGPAQTKLF